MNRRNENMKVSLLRLHLVLNRLWDDLETSIHNDDLRIALSEVERLRRAIWRKEKDESRRISTTRK